MLLVLNQEGKNTRRIRRKELYNLIMSLIMNFSIKFYWCDEILFSQVLVRSYAIYHHFEHNMC